MLNVKAFAETIKKLRLEKGMSQPELAEQMMVSRSAISMWELGSRIPDIELLDRLSHCLGTDMQFLLELILGKNEEAVTIIVVEDIPALLEGSVAMIQEVVPNALIKGFESGPPAISFCKKNGADIAFLDIGLDEYMNGLELARKLKEINPYINNIFLTNNTRYLEQAIYDHCSGYIVKPLTRPRIRHELANLRFSRHKLEGRINYEE